MNTPHSTDFPSLIPAPVSWTPDEGGFRVTRSVRLLHGPDLKNEAGLLAEDLEKLAGWKPETIAAENTETEEPLIRMFLDAELDLPADGYELEISPMKISIAGTDRKGVFNATRTLLQLIDPADPTCPATWKLPRLRITDWPRFSWRGLHLDSVRHFHSVEDIKKLLGWMAFHKLNVFHWHLADDQGWRLEIKKFPKLTEIGAWRDFSPPYWDIRGSDGLRHGGFYSQDDVRGIVEYAKQRHISVVPGIPMPGHAAAAIAAYPELGNDDIPGFSPPQVSTRWGLHPHTFSPKEETFEFLEAVFSEVKEIFPYRFIHIGGDAPPGNQWRSSPLAARVMEENGLSGPDELHAWFIERIGKILESLDRTPIGWDRVRGGRSGQAAASETIAVSSWLGAEALADAAREGLEAVATPKDFLDFSRHQLPADAEHEKNIGYACLGGILPISKILSFDPVPPELSDTQPSNILGVQAQVWTELMPDWKMVEHHVFPRIAALAEIAWTPQKSIDTADFHRRLKSILARYDAAGIHRNDPFLEQSVRSRLAVSWNPEWEFSRILTNLPASAEHLPEHAIDGKPESSFQSTRPPEPDDHFTGVLENPLESDALIEVPTGSGETGMLENGVLEASEDGQEWSCLSSVSHGMAAGIAASGTRRIRLRATAGQTGALILRKIAIRRIHNDRVAFTSLPWHEKHFPECILGKDPATFFWSSCSLERADHFTIALPRPLETLAFVEVATGGPEGSNRDHLEHGVLEASPDGVVWNEIGRFSDGLARGIAGRGTRRVRLRATEPQENWLNLKAFEIREIRDAPVVFTSLPFLEKHSPEQIFDDNPDTHFRSQRSPGPGDHFTIALPQPLEKFARVEAVTGGGGGNYTDHLEHGVLEARIDNKWIEIARFMSRKKPETTHGTACGFAPPGTDLLRLRAIEKQKNWVNIKKFEWREIGNNDFSEKAAMALVTSMEALEDHPPEHAIEDNDEMFFWSCHEPLDGDHFTVLLGEPLDTDAEVRVVTGGEACSRDHRDILEHGVLEGSSDGIGWIEIECSDRGEISGFAQSGPLLLRLRATEDQNHWMILRRFELKRSATNDTSVS